VEAAEKGGEGWVTQKGLVPQKGGDNVAVGNSHHPY